MEKYESMTYEEYKIWKKETERYINNTLDNLYGDMAKYTPFWCYPKEILDLMDELENAKYFFADEIQDEKIENLVRIFGEEGIMRILEREKEVEDADISIW